MDSDDSATSKSVYDYLRERPAILRSFASLASMRAVVRNSTEESENQAFSVLDAYETEALRRFQEFRAARGVFPTLK